MAGGRSMGKAKKPAGKDWSKGVEKVRRGEDKAISRDTSYRLRVSKSDLLCWIKCTRGSGEGVRLVKGEENEIVCSPSSLPSFSSAIRPPMELVHPTCQFLSLSLSFYLCGRYFKLTLSLAYVSAASLFNSLVRPSVYSLSLDRTDRRYVINYLGRNQIRKLCHDKNFTQVFQDRWIISIVRTFSVLTPALCKGWF